MPRKHTLRLKTRARLLAEGTDSTAAPVTQRDLALDLKQSLRLLYERSAVTVREIAQAAGVSERMLYKYAEQGAWTDRETRARQKADALALLDPAEAARIAERARNLVRLSDEAAAREATRVSAHRDHKKKSIAFERHMRAYELLASSLAELGRMACAGHDLPHRGETVSAKLQDLIWRQMRMAFDGAGLPLWSS